ncbi:MAG TPA: hypothetical protein PLZ31_11965, partial [Myxococcota bacterium]|nr:hypothetical protein [Myxococcota bacterium]
MLNKSSLCLISAAGLILAVACSGNPLPGDLGGTDTKDAVEDIVKPDNGQKDVKDRDIGDTTVPDVKDVAGTDVVPDVTDAGEDTPDVFVCTRDDQCPGDPADECVVGKCEKGTCVFVPKTCDDGFDCTADGCSADDGGCFHQYIFTQGCKDCLTNDDCRSENPCDQSACVDAPDPDTSLENYDRFPTDTGRVCFRKACADCDDSNPCTTDYCTPEGVVMHDAVACSDFNQCTTDSCDPNTGACIHTPIASCTVCANGDNAACNTEATNPDRQCLIGYCKAVLFEGGIYDCSATVGCPDGSQCDLDLGKCMGNICAYQDNSCNDNNFCTADSCDSALGCVHTCICGSCETLTQLP